MGHNQGDNRRRDNAALKESPISVLSEEMVFQPEMAAAI